MPKESRSRENLDEALNPSKDFDARRGVGKDPRIAGKRQDESELDALGDDLSNSREENPRDSQADGS